MNSKIQNDIKELVEEQVISQDVASKIESYYQSKQINTPNKLFTVFAVLGSTLVGSSIALVSQIYNIPGDLSSFLLT